MNLVAKHAVPEQVAAGEVPSERACRSSARAPSRWLVEEQVTGDRCGANAPHRHCHDEDRGERLAQAAANRTKAENLRMYLAQICNIAEIVNGLGLGFGNVTAPRNQIRAILTSFNPLGRQLSR